MSPKTPTAPVLVTGATGKVGSELVAALLHRDVPVRAAVRDPAAAALPAGVEVVRADLTDPDALARAADGARAAFLLWPFWGVEAVEEHGPATVAALARTGRIVYLSSEAAGAAPASWWARVEQLVRGSGAEWTLLRPTGFAANAATWADQVRDGDVVRWIYADAARSLIAERDMAAVAARALLDDDLAGETLTITGPATITQAEQVVAIGAGLGRPLRWEELDEDEAVAMLGAGAREEMLPAWRAMIDRPEVVTDTVERVTGRPAQPFAAWAAEHADRFR